MEKIKITNGINGTNYRLETREASLVRLNEGIYALELRIEPKEGEDTTQPRAIHHYDEVNNKVITQIFLNEDRVKELSGVFTSEVIRSESIKLDKGLVKLTRNNLLDLDSFSYPEFLIVDESYDDMIDNVDRLKCIITLIENLSTLSENDFNDILNKMLLIIYSIISN
jgi:hypothetical protein